MKDEATGTGDLTQYLDGAIDGLLSWCTEFHLPFVVDQRVPDPTQLTRAVRHLLPLEEWFETHKGDAIFNQASVRSLLAQLKKIRAASATIVENGAPTSEQAYRELMSDMRAFIESARRLERAFAIASSELDVLTGIQNRHAMHRALAHERERLVRSGQTSFIALADIDHFKAVNDRHGHTAGDRVLAYTAGLLAEGLRAYDQVFRYGGEEFLILLSDADGTTAKQVLERLRSTVQRRGISVGGEKELNITVSFGAAPLNAEENIERTLERADQALYAAKSAGRNRVVINA